MHAPEPVDAIFLGSGQAANPLASAFADKGKRVVVIESKHVGGTCVNEGCTPTKTMIASAKVAAQARDGARFGVHAGQVSVHMDEVRARKREVVDVWRSGSEKRLEDNKNIQLVRGVGSFTDAKTVSVAGKDGGTRAFTAPHIFVNTGLRSFTPSELGLKGDAPYLTNETVMELDTLPKHLIVLGGSYIAVEFGQMFRRFGSEVTLVNRGPQLLPREDPEIAEELGKIFHDDGIHVLFNANATAFAKTEDGISLTVATDKGEEILHGSHLLLAAGRKPNTESLNLFAAGLKADSHGFLPANERLETTVPGIYALGDVKGGPAFTHISYDDYRIAAANLLEGGSRNNQRPPDSIHGVHRPGAGPHRHDGGRGPQGRP